MESGSFYSNEIDIIISRSAQALLGTFIDMNGADLDDLGNIEDIPCEDDDGLGVTLWAPTISRGGLLAMAHLSASEEAIKTLVDKIMGANDTWWRELGPALTELKGAYHTATGKSLFEIQMVESGEYNMCQN